MAAPKDAKSPKDQKAKPAEKVFADRGCGDEKVYASLSEEEKKEFDAWAKPYIPDGTEFGVKGVVRGAQGGTKFVDKDELANQAGVMTDLMKSMGRNMLEGKSIINISLPVRIFESRSFLERMTDIWCYMPLFLRRAAISKSPVERMKWVVTWIMSGLHRGCKQAKPFNPILGETWQAEYPDGTQMLFEQKSHHPPVSSFQVFGPDGLWSIHGDHEYTASFRPNGVIGGQLGPYVLKFKDGTVIQFPNPFIQMTGLIFGDRLYNWIDNGKPVDFVDLKNNIRCDVRLNPDGLSGLSSWISTPKTPADSLRGQITSNDKKLKTQQVYSNLEGSWIDGIKFDNIPYWNNGQFQPFSPNPIVVNCLPSDSRFREDLVALKKAQETKEKADMDLAQKAKEKLENLQRFDRKLKKDAAAAAAKQRK